MFEDIVYIGPPKFHCNMSLYNGDEYYISINWNTGKSKAGGMAGDNQYAYVHTIHKSF